MIFKGGLEIPRPRCSSSTMSCHVDTKLGRTTAHKSGFGISALKAFISGTSKKRIFKSGGVDKITVWAAPNLSQEGMVIGKVYSDES